MARLQDLPIDAWAVVFAHVPRCDAVEQFNRLHAAGVFDRLAPRLDTFWSIVRGDGSDLAMRDAEASPFSEFPDATLFRESANALTEMGVPLSRAVDVVGRAQGSLGEAMHLLGWD